MSTRQKLIKSAAVIILAALVNFSTALILNAESAADILNRIDGNEYVKSMKFQGTMIITNGYRVMVKKFNGIAEESDKKYSFIEFTNPEDAGVKYLKIDNEMWISSPDADEPVKISGHLLKESMMGSDMSYEDATSNDKLVDIYSAQLIGSEEYNGTDCYKLELNVKPGKEKKAPYAKRVLWVDKTKYVIMMEELYAVSGKLMKISTVEKVDKIGSRYYPVVSKMKNLLKKNSATVFELNGLELDVKVDRAKFSKQNL